MKLSQNNIRFLILLILPIHFLILRNSIMNRHTHVLPGGFVVTHAHPLNKENAADGRAAQHGHTKAEFFFFQLITVTFFDVPAQVVFDHAFRVFIQTCIIPVDNYYSFLQATNKTSRAPPSFPEIV